MKKSNSANIAVSCRVRFARNLAKYPFASRMTASQEQEIREAVRNAVFSANAHTEKEFEYIKMEELPEDKATVLRDLRLISKDFAESGRIRGLILSKNRDLSVMINEEDHLRVQAFSEGLEIESVYEKADALMRLIESSVEMGFDEKLGYLTHCPTNLGSGMRVSVMLHLPMLTQNGYMEKVVSSALKLGLEVRGMYGEGSNASGFLYQISNRITMSLTPREVLQLISEDAEKLCKMELELQKRAAEDIRVKDKIFRSAGALKSAYLISYNELLEHLSFLRIGANTNLIDNVDGKKLNKLLFETTAAGITNNVKTGAGAQSRDAARAEYVKKILNE